MRSLQSGHLCAELAGNDCQAVVTVTASPMNALDKPTLLSSPTRRSCRRSSWVLACHCRLVDKSRTVGWRSSGSHSRPRCTHRCTGWCRCRDPAGTALCTVSHSTATQRPPLHMSRLVHQGTRYEVINVIFHTATATQSDALLVTISTQACVYVPSLPQSSSDRRGLSRRTLPPPSW